MKKALQFDFLVNEETHTINVTRAFEADRQLVWDAFTKQELLDQWWAPKPWTSYTKVMDFRVGGRRFYAMVSPEGKEHWSVQVFTFIDPIKAFKYLDAFTDQEENVNDELPGSDWTLNFEDKGGATAVHIIIKHKTLVDLKKNVAMGFKEGFTSTLNELNHLLAELKK